MKTLAPGRMLVLVLAAAAFAAPARPQSDESDDERPARFGPEAMTYRFTKQAKRSPIPQPGEGFPNALSAPTEAPITVPFVAEGTIVPWQKAADYLGGDRITVEGRIVDTYQTTGPCLLKFDAKDRGAFVIAAFTRDWTELKDPPAEYYRGRTVRVTGPVTAYDGNPQMKVEDPSQIQIVGM